MKRLLTLSSALFAVAACGDDNPGTPDAATPDVGMLDSAVDAPFVAPTPFKIDISSGGPDQVMAAAAGPSGSFYVAGWTADSPTGTRYVFVAKLTSAGALDTTFGIGGVFTSTVEFSGATDEIDMVVQSDGKIVVAATVANDVNAADRDIGLIRVTTAGALDGTFGVTGFARVNLSTAHDTGTALVALDASRALALGPSDTLFLHAVSRGSGAATGGGPRTDTDFTVAKLTANGLLDVTWGGGDGIFQLDIQESTATPRGLRVLAYGSVIAGGYANTPLFNKVQPVLYRLTPAGVLDANFDVFHDVVLSEVTEIYDISVEGSHITTAGYGRTAESATANDWVSMRFDTSTGARSTTFGGTSNGAVVIDVSGTMAGDNCRTAIGLPGSKTALVGSTGAAPDRDAALAILTENGQLDSVYGTGLHTFQIGGDDQWWAGALSGGTLLVAGWRGHATQTATDNDDSYAILLPLE